MRFERAIYADGFRLGENFMPKAGFVPLSFTLKDDESDVLRQAVTSLSIHNPNFTGLALTASERKVEQELKDNCSSILTGKKNGWYLLGARAFHKRRTPGLGAEFYVFHVSSGLNFTIQLDEKNLLHFSLESQFYRIISDMLDGRFIAN